MRRSKSWQLQPEIKLKAKDPDMMKQENVTGADLPPEDCRKIDLLVEKLCAGEIFKERRFIVTRYDVLFAKVMINFP